MALYSPLYTSEIERAARSDPLQRKHFLGVFANDELPHTIHSFPALLVVNTDPISKPGTHWIAYYFDHQQRLDYFDSQGLPPNGRLARFAKRNSWDMAYCNKPLQGFHSAACGYYCIAFLALRARGYTLKNIISLYWGGKPGVYDNTVCETVNTLFRVGRRQQLGSSSSTNSGTGQCSCTVSEWCCRMQREW
jgi:hypothetical protein